MEKQIEEIENSEDLWSAVRNLQLLASNEKSHGVSELIDKTIEKCRIIDDKKALVNLYGYKIPIIYNFKEKLPLASQLINEMLTISEEINYQDGIVWAYSYIWYAEKIKGNKEKSAKAMDKSLEILNQLTDCDKYIHYFILYSYAVDKWLEEHDPTSIQIFEDCLNYFYHNKFYRSLAQTLGMLSVIYMRTQDNKKALETSIKILSNKSLFNKMPDDVKGIVYYFTGLTHLLNSNLSLAESSFTDAYDILKLVSEKSIYFSYFITLCAYFSVVKALQGKIIQAFEMINEVDKLLKKEFYIKNLDKNTESQILHTLNLIKFYVYSRKIDFDLETSLDLIDEIIEGCKNHYSDFLLLTEFILNANLDNHTLKELSNTNYFSLNRVKHIIEFMIEKTITDEEISDEQRHLNCINILKNRIRTDNTTFIEDTYAGLLLAQELLDLQRFDEIYPLLRKYKDQLHKIEVLEMRIFMKAFIQVGEFRNGDPLAPAVQYMAIKKCRKHRFTKLEQLLFQHQQTMRNWVLPSYL